MALSVFEYELAVNLM